MLCSAWFDCFITKVREPGKILAVGTMVVWCGELCFGFQKGGRAVLACLNQHDSMIIAVAVYWWVYTLVSPSAL